MQLMNMYDQNNKKKSAWMKSKFKSEQTFEVLNDISSFYNVRIFQYDFIETERKEERES